MECVLPLIFFLHNLFFFRHSIRPAAQRLKRTHYSLDNSARAEKCGRERKREVWLYLGILLSSLCRRKELAGRKFGIPNRKSLFFTSSFCSLSPNITTVTHIRNRNVPCNHFLVISRNIWIYRHLSLSLSSILLISGVARRTLTLFSLQPFPTVIFSSSSNILLLLLLWMISP